MLSRLTGAAVRAILVAILIATPSIVLPHTHSDANQIVALISIFAAILVMIEYASVYPSLIEFRDAPPFNRIRYVSLMLMVFLLSQIMAVSGNPSTLAEFTYAVGTVIGMAMDFPYSPVRLFVLAVPDGATIEQISLVRTAAGLCYLISLVSLAVFLIIIRMGRWPSRGASFNVWVNLPTFDPTAGGDVVDRLTRDSRLNVILGFLLPFVIPAAMQTASSLFDSFTFASPQTMIWTISAWSFLPASLFMRGIAMARIAAMIAEKRQFLTAQQDGLVLA
ncbi:hypothetical protein N9C89_01310 [Halocynthiibacter sp. SDUM655004]|uniref:Uncharacterized protein n=1 Tax=Halocynthiibacter halioticoli TaxID=2986804 RepID=A0AAE3IYD6_9RHOB|nr:hypothetical protein [Halocynthiibacter sp. C4]MCV6823178.1 hypothetical protein [Halocynthiibacter halioticoli]MCW4056179.1 hypothetical protein [Halocynthiibacter sp. SDUM655004]MDE0590855.1 hypothetical protein [Halocynthiibacter sp. C4]